MTIPNPYQQQVLDSQTAAAIERVLQTLIQIFSDDKIFSFNIRFPIQERFYAAFMNVVSKLVGLLHLPKSGGRIPLEDEGNMWQSLEMSTKISVFTMVFCGLSSGFAILSTVS
mmetsp:Transcript_24872/g.38681  ORF Transcript_24872/g.38681 Transcript_24872/m.38681 type:complete len:113 (-) Transcript_24872:1788-2126(-)